MGAGRKTETIPWQEKIQRNPSVNCSVTARNLRINDLRGVILGCTKYTMKECLSNQIFGLPAAHFAYIKKIKPGLPLFLFNYSDRQLHGIYEAASNGEMNINPYGWSEDGNKPTKYPAQVRMRIRKQCKALSENQFKPILMDNYYTEDHFWFELDYVQTSHLVMLFESSPIAKPRRAVKHDKEVKSERGSEVKPRQAKVLQYSSNWEVLQDMDMMDSEDDTPISESGSSSATPLEDENEEELVYLKLLQLVNEREKEKANCHSICRRNVWRWFSIIPLSGYVALVFILWVCQRFQSEE